MYFLLGAPYATLRRCYVLAAHLGAIVNCVRAQYSIVWIYVLPRGCAFILDLDTLLTNGLNDLDVSVGHLLYVLHVVLHMLLVVVLCSV